MFTGKDTTVTVQPWCTPQVPQILEISLIYYAECIMLNASC